MGLESEAQGWLFAVLGHTEVVWFLLCWYFCCFFPSAKLPGVLL